MSNLLQTIQLLLPLLFTRIGPHLNFHNFRSFPTGLMDSRTLLQLSMYIFHNSQNDLTLLRTLYQIFSVNFQFPFLRKSVSKNNDRLMLDYLSCAIFSLKLFYFLEQTFRFASSFFSPKRIRLCLSICR